MLLRPERPPTAGAPCRSRVVAELCRDCRHCLVACPTAAIRVRDGVPVGARPPLHRLHLLHRRLRARALTLDATAPARRLGDVGWPCRRRCSPGSASTPPPTRARGARRAGFDEVSRSTATRTTCAARSSTRRHRRAPPRPVISPVCPPVVNLIEVKFPSLLDHLAPLASPWEALAARPSRDATYAVSCPSQRTALARAAPTPPRRTVEPGLLRDLVLLAPAPAARASRRAAAGRRRRRPAARDRRAPRASPCSSRSRTACSPAWRRSSCTSATAAASARRCWPRTPLSPPGAGAPRAAPRRGRAGHRRPLAPFAARPGIRLDADMADAIHKLARLDAESRALPGKDCGVCGAPTCAALAEDIVMERAARALCPYRSTEEEEARHEARGHRPRARVHRAHAGSLRRQTPTSTVATRPTC